MDIQKIIDEILAEKANATNKEKMGALVDKALATLTDVISLTPDEKMASLITSHNEIITSKDQEIAVLKQEVLDARSSAEEAIALFNEKSGAETSVLEVKVKGKEYIINYGVSYDGKTYSAADLKENIAVATQLVEIGSGALTIKEG